MSAGGLGGVRPSGEYPISDDLSDGGGEDEAVEAPVIRGSTGPEAWQALQSLPSANVLAADLQEQVDLAEQDGGLGGDEATDEVFEELDSVYDDMDALEDEYFELTDQLSSGKVSGLTTEEIKERITWIEEELDFLYEYESMLLDELDNGDLGFEESFWCEWDLWDVNFDIFDLEEELAMLTGEMFDRTFDDWFGGYWDAFGESVDRFLGYFEGEQQVESEQRVDDGREATRQLIRELAEKTLADHVRTADQGLKDRVLAQSAERSTPELKPEARERILGLRPTLARVRETPTREGLQEIRDVLTELRGPRPRHDLGAI